MEEPRSATHGARVGVLIRNLLGFPLRYKLLLANIGIVMAGAVTGTAFTAAIVRSDPTLSTLKLIGVFTAVGVGVSTLVNVAVVKIALSPLRHLEEAAGRVQQGDSSARAAPSAMADADLRQLTETFNQTLANLAAYRQRLREVSAATLRAAEDERKRLALELHDETAPTLVALLARLGAARASTDPAVTDACLEAACDDLTHAIEGIRRIAWALRPPALEEVGVVAAVSEHARSVAEANDLHIDLDADPIDGLLGPDAEVALYRLVQEALSNATRHAEARTIRLRIARLDGAIAAAVSDDGKGFTATGRRHGTDGGLGLLGMQERAQELGGSFHVVSRPGRGTSVHITIPTTRDGHGD